MVLDIMTPEKARVGVWRVEEDQDFFLNNLTLSPTETGTLESLPPVKKHEWLASRYLLDCLVDHHTRIETGTRRTGKPYLVGRQEEISFSHSDACVAVMVGETDLGIDIQRCKEKIARVEHKFANAAESARIDRSDALLHLHVLWGAKEALYKVHAKKQLSFLSNIFVDLPEDIGDRGRFSGQINIRNTVTVCVLYYVIIDNYVLVYGQKVI